MMAARVEVFLVLNSLSSSKTRKRESKVNLFVEVESGKADIFNRQINSNIGQVHLANTTILLVYTLCSTRI